MRERVPKRQSSRAARPLARYLCRNLLSSHVRHMCLLASGRLQPSPIIDRFSSAVLPTHAKNTTTHGGLARRLEVTRLVLLSCRRAKEYLRGGFSFYRPLGNILAGVCSSHCIELLCDG